jgi:hypothetical protein
VSLTNNRNVWCVLKPSSKFHNYCQH